MRIGFDIQVIADGNRTGLFNHFRNLVKAMRQDIQHEIRLLSVNDHREDTKTIASQKELIDLFDGTAMSFVEPRYKIYKIWHYFSICNKAEVLLHNLHGRLPLATRGANVFMVPDVIPLSFDYGIQGFEKDYLAFYRRAVDQGDGIIVSSEHSKADLMNRVGGEPDRIAVIPLAPGREFYPRTNEEIVKDLQRYGLNSQKYVLFVSTIEKRKNHAVLVRAFRRLLDRDPSLPHKLVFVGGKWIGHEAVFDLIDRVGLKDRVVWLGFADALPSIYAGADAFVFPSFYEGFGLPPLEAMACGLPTLVADASSLPEVVGDSGILFDPNDDSYLAEQLYRVLIDKDYRDTLCAKVLSQSAKFTWEKTAKAYLDFFVKSRGRAGF
jgi:glycosyltransferase involved in cell wall biosynthesis